MTRPSLKYGSDKPDLRNPLLISDVAEHFTTSGFGLFEKIVAGGGTVPRDPRAGHGGQEPQVLRRHERVGAQAKATPGLGYVTCKQGEFGGPIAKNHGTEGMEALYAALGLGPDDGLFFAAGKPEQAAKLAGLAPHARRRAARASSTRTASNCAGSSISRSTNGTRTPRRSSFAHNPFSMPQGGMAALEGS